MFRTTRGESRSITEGMFETLPACKVYVKAFEKNPFYITAYIKKYFITEKFFVVNTITHNVIVYASVYARQGCTMVFVSLEPVWWHSCCVYTMAEEDEKAFKSRED